MTSTRRPVSSTASPTQELGHPEGQVERLAGVEARVADRLVALFEVLGQDLLGPAQALGDVLAGDLDVDPAARTVTRAGRLVALTAREFAVVEFLARRAGEVISRSELLDHVWDQNYEGSTNIVDVYVGYLRRKLEDPFGRPLIRTVRGAGYVIDP